MKTNLAIQPAAVEASKPRRTVKRGRGKAIPLPMTLIIPDGTSRRELDKLAATLVGPYWDITSQYDASQCPAVRIGIDANRDLMVLDRAKAFRIPRRTYWFPDGMLEVTPRDRNPLCDLSPSAFARTLKEASEALATHDLVTAQRMLEAYIQIEEIALALPWLVDLIDKQRLGIPARTKLVARLAQLRTLPASYYYREADIESASTALIRFDRERLDGLRQEVALILAILDQLRLPLQATVVKMPVVYRRR